MALNDLSSAVPGFGETSAQRRGFVAVQAAKAGVGAVLGLLFVGLVGRPDLFEGVALAGLLAQAAFAALAITGVSLAALEQAGLAVFALLVGYLAVLTGGVASPLLVWLALVPAEAALTGGRAAVMRAGLAACLAL